MEQPKTTHKYKVLQWHKNIEKGLGVSTNKNCQRAKTHAPNDSKI